MITILVLHEIQMEVHEFSYKLLMVQNVGALQKIDMKLN